MNIRLLLTIGILFATFACSLQENARFAVDSKNQDNKSEASLELFAPPVVENTPEEETEAVAAPAEEGSDCKQPTMQEIKDLIDDFVRTHPETIACGQCYSFDNCFRRRDTLQLYIEDVAQQENWCAGTLTNVTVFFKKGHGWLYHTCARYQCEDGQVYCDPHGGPAGEPVEVFTCTDGTIPWPWANNCEVEYPGTDLPWEQLDEKTCYITPAGEKYCHPYVDNSGPTHEEQEEWFEGYNDCMEKAVPECRDQCKNVVDDPMTPANEPQSCRMGCYYRKCPVDKASY